MNKYTNPDFFKTEEGNKIISEFYDDLIKYGNRNQITVASSFVTVKQAFEENKTFTLIEIDGNKIEIAPAIINEKEAVQDYGFSRDSWGNGDHIEMVGEAILITNPNNKEDINKILEEKFNDAQRTIKDKKEPLHCVYKPPIYPKKPKTTYSSFRYDDTFEPFIHFYNSTRRLDIAIRRDAFINLFLNRIKGDLYCKK